MPPAAIPVPAPPGSSPRSAAPPTGSPDGPTLPSANGRVHLLAFIGAVSIRTAQSPPNLYPLRFELVVQRTSVAVVGPEEAPIQKSNDRFPLLGKPFPALIEEPPPIDNSYGIDKDGENNDYKHFELNSKHKGSAQGKSNQIQ